MNYTYNELAVEKSYCFTISGKIESWMNKFTNLFKDEMMWFAKFLDANYNQYQKIGNILEYNYSENFTCIDIRPGQEFSSYNISQCAFFNDDGTCKYVNDDNYFEDFVETLYNNISAKTCINELPDGTCYNYETDPKSNNTALLPLIDVLKKELSIMDGVVSGNKNVEINLNQVENSLSSSNSPSNSSTSTSITTNSTEIQPGINTPTNNNRKYNWPGPCKPIPQVTIKITCPSGYTSATYLSLCKFLFFILFVLLF
jgi:hypothetical protein